MESKFGLEKFLLVIIGAHYAYGVYISTDVAQAVCTSLSRYKSTNELVNRIDHEIVQKTLPLTWIRWTKCDNTGRQCSQFVSETNNQNKRTHDPSETRAPNLKQEPQSTGKPKIIITLKAEPKCSEGEIPHKRTSKRKRSAHSIDITSKMIALQQHAQDTQKGVMELLEKKYGTNKGRDSTVMNIDSLWITNEIVVSGASLEDVQRTVEGNADIRSVRKEEIITLDRPNARDSQTKSKNYEDIIKNHWGVAEINAPEVWKDGYNGTGVTIGIIDDGVDASHEILMDNYRKDYGWFDAVEFSETYRWTGDHGTHVTGTAVGRRRIGVAPGAAFISCLACSAERCSESSLKKCAQWMYCPTDPKGKNPDCSKRPHVINMSLGSRQTENPTEFYTTFSSLVDCWRVGGIFPVFAAGQSELPWVTCQQVSFPGILNTAIGVGNVRIVNKTDADQGRPVEGHFFQGFISSAHGPAFPPYNATVKPDLSAPGHVIVSSVPGNTYFAHTGTSMAAPHVAGTVALMLQKNPNLSYDEIKSILFTTAIETAKTAELLWICGGIRQTTYPNHAVGHGVVNAYKAVAKVTKVRQTSCKHKKL